MNLEKQLNDLRKIHTQPAELNDVEMLQELIWELTDLDEIELPINFDLMDEKEQFKFLKMLIIDNIDQEILDQYIREQAKIRVETRKELEKKGIRTTGV